jgi:uncharacterized metal-binding protein YceD (DUF177 family)
MVEIYQIYPHHLKDGQREAIEGQLTPDFLLDKEEPEIAFAQPVTVVGEAYVADDSLIVHLSAKTDVSMPCSICNRPTSTPIEVADFYSVEPIEELTSPVFDFRPGLREDILLALPAFIECSGSNCPEREKISNYLKKEVRATESTHFPFADL